MASAKAEASLNRFTSDGWDLMQVDWDDDLHRVTIIFRRAKPPVQSDEWSNTSAGARRARH